MPRESTRQARTANPSCDTFDYAIKQKGGTVWVTLSGILDRIGLERLIAGVAPRLGARGFRVVLEGSRLMHIDYRTIRELLRWNRSLRTFRHQLYLADWSDYLKAILSMEDWDGELNPGSRYPAAWRVLTGTSTGQRP